METLTGEMLSDPHNYHRPPCQVQGLVQVALPSGDLVEDVVLAQRLWLHLECTRQSCA